MQTIERYDGVYLKTYLRPFDIWLADPRVTEILVNRPGEVWIERSDASVMQHVLIPDITDTLIERLAAQVARTTHQGINRASPLLSASLPTGERIQMVGPPVTPRHWAMAIRRHVAVDAALEDYVCHRVKASLGNTVRKTLIADEDPVEFLQDAVLNRKTVLVSGGTSTGKTTFLNTLLNLTPSTDRIVTIEDTPEVAVRHPNALSMIAVKGDLGEASVTIADLLEAALRLRPDRLVVGEVRGPEAATFLRAVNTGHPGSITTIHANTPEGALEQLALMVLQAGMPLTRSDTLAYCQTVVDVIVQLGRVDGRRQIVSIKNLESMR